VKKQDIDNIWFDINCNYNLEAPVVKDYNIGELNVNISSKKIESIDLLVNETIEKKNEYDYVFEILECV